MLSEAACVMMASINPNKTPAKFLLRGDKRASCQVLLLLVPLEGEETVRGRLTVSGAAVI